MNTIQKALQGAPLLTIPHPRAMLKEPALKGGAWAALQKLKAMM
jgi:uracil-DNA glycosylase